jgi:hypothetical protein
VSIANGSGSETLTDQFRGKQTVAIGLISLFKPEAGRAGGEKIFLLPLSISSK